MKKTAIAIMATLALTAGAAMAYPGGGYNNNCGGPCYGQGNYQQGGQPCYGGQRGYGMKGGKGGPGMKGQGNFGPGMGQNFEPVTEEKAKEKITEAIKDFKGYTIADTKVFEMPRGKVYQYIVKDAGGNEFIFHVNPRGFVRGPFLKQK